RSGAAGAGADYGYHAAAGHLWIPRRVYIADADVLPVYILECARRVTAHGPFAGGSRAQSWTVALAGVSPCDVATPASRFGCGQLAGGALCGARFRRGLYDALQYVYAHHLCTIRIVCGSFGGS